VRKREEKQLQKQI
jgi:hypothetical protein